MDNRNKFLLVLALLFFIAIVISVSVSFSKVPKEKEAFAQNPSPSNKILTVDMNGNTSLYTTNKDSMIVTDSNGAMKNLPFPKGLIMIWHNNKTTNPTKEDLAPGWSLCDGGTYNGYRTPDLRGRFVLGAGSGSNLSARTVGVVGGEENHTLTVDEMPSHSHQVPNIYGSGQQDRSTGQFNWFKMDGYANDLSAYYSRSSGGGKPHNVMPPYYVLCYICYTGDGL